MDTNDELRRLLKERGWSAYRLAVNSGLSESTIANILKRNNLPGINTLRSICDAFGMTLSQFFSEDEETKELLQAWATISAEQKQIITKLIKSMNTK